jgi:hypothetical protein
MVDQNDSGFLGGERFVNAIGHWTVLSGSIRVPAPDEPTSVMSGEWGHHAAPERCAGVDGLSSQRFYGALSVTAR